MREKRAYALLKGMRDWLESEAVYLQTRRHFPEIRQYALEETGRHENALEGGTASKRYVLGVVGGYEVLGYVRLGYDWLAPYYNPLLMFAEVHYFQRKASRTRILDWGYPFYVHGSASPSKIVRVCRKHRVGILRAYDTTCGRMTIEAARALNIPVIVSVH
jgi:hypothetical protein